MPFLSICVTLPGVQLPPLLVIMPDDPDDYIDTLPTASGGRKKSRRPLTAPEIVRELTEEDLPALAHNAAPLDPAPRQSLTTIRHTHHQLARLIASGSSVTEACLITGYSIAYVSTLSDDPAFAELLNYYSTQRDAIFVDVIERMRSLGLATLEEIQQRLTEAPDEWSRRELMELAELMLLKPAMARQNSIAPSGPSGGGISVNVQFVQAAASRPAGPVIDLQVEEAK